VSSVLVVAVLVVLTLVAVYGAARPYRRSAVPALEPLTDPLEDRRLALLISLRDLETARGSGGIEEHDYVRLRTETEGRMARVLRAIDSKEQHAASSDGRPGRRNTVPVITVALVLVAALGAGLVPSLMRSLQQRADAGSTPIADTSSISFFEQRVRDHPHDVAARLDLAHRYLDAGLFGDAYRQYVAALSLDPKDVEALANLGILMHLSGKPQRGLQFEHRALRVDPGYPQALFYEGVILLKGLGRPAAAIAPLRAYQRGSPFGSEGDQARKFLAEARRRAGRLASHGGGR
jgi:cytochrome c-type biogenesis protein CcmH/NrfG